MKIAVITDSGTGWNEHQAQERGLFYLPLLVKCGEEEFLDGINITVEELYERLRQGEMPSTSMPPVGRVEAMFAQLKEQGYEYVSGYLINRQYDRGCRKTCRTGYYSDRSIYYGEYAGIFG